jgi:predicted dehydrogenase
MAGRAGRRLGIGMIGAGMVGQVAHLANFAQIAACEVVALAELRPELGRKAAARFGVPKVYASHHELLRDDRVEAVVVVTRRAATGPVVLDALIAGKHVLSEKPMAHTLAQAQRLVEAAASRNLRYAVGFMKRHDAGAQLAKRLLDEARETGALGRILLARVFCHGGEFACGVDGFVMTDEPRPEGLALWPISPEWLPSDLAEDYAWFLNVCSHDVNILRYLLPERYAVKAADLSRRNGKVVLFDAGTFPALLEFAESSAHEWQEGVEVLFERGRLALRFASPMRRNEPARVTLDRGGGGSMEHAVDWSWSFRRQADAFVEDVLTGGAPLASGEDSLEDMRLMEEIWRSRLRDGANRHDPRERGNKA